MNTNTNDCRRWRLCDDSVDAIHFALSVNAENGEEVGFRLVDHLGDGGTYLEADSPHDALDAADYIERECDIADIASEDAAYDIRRIRRVAQFWAQARGGEA